MVHSEEAVKRTGMVHSLRGSSQSRVARARVCVCVCVYVCGGGSNSRTLLARQATRVQACVATCVRGGVLPNAHLGFVLARVAVHDFNYPCGLMVCCGGGRVAGCRMQPFEWRSGG